MKFTIEDLDEIEILAVLKGEKDAASEKVHEQIDKIVTAEKLLNAHGSRRTVAKLLCEKYRIGMVSAYKWINHAIYFFGNIVKSDKDYYRKFLVDHLSKAFLKALKNDDFKGASSLAKEIRLTLGLDKDDASLPDYSKVQPATTIIGFFPELTGVTLPPNYQDEINVLLSKHKRTIKSEDIFKNIEPTGIDSTDE